jgi:hypothetical protein
VADEICPPSKKTYDKSSSPFYHRKGTREINLIP